MAKRGTLDHPKTKRLARALNLPAWAALGLLEAVWHWVGRYALDGSLTIDDLNDCADTIRFDEGGEALANALSGAGWLDQAHDGWYIHDWHDHADDTTKKALLKRGEQFANGSVVRKTRENDPSANDSRTIREPLANDSPLPEPSQSLARALPDSRIVSEYATSIGKVLDADRFCDYYSSTGWTSKGGSPIKDWKLAVRNWIKRDEERNGKPSDIPPKRPLGYTSLTPEQAALVKR